MANKLNVNPTRVELLNLKKRLQTAKRGHKLLKEKRDGLMKEFMGIIKEVKVLREKLEVMLAEGFKHFVFASADMSKSELEESIAMPTRKIKLLAETKNVMSVNIPQFDFSAEGEYLSYSLATTSSVLDEAMERFADSLRDMISLAQKEHSARLLAIEIEKTRRRVNALEHFFIPSIEITIKYITSKLNEQERGTIITLMKIKDIMEKQAEGA